MNNLDQIKQFVVTCTVEEKKEVLNHQTSTLMSPLMLACISNNLILMEYLFKEGADLNIKMINTKFIDLNKNKNCSNKKLTIINKGSSILHIACITKNFNIIKFLIDNNVDINSRDQYNATPLHNICYLFNNVINNNKIYNYKNEDFIEIYEIIKFLLKKGADVNISTIPQKKIPLHIISDKFSYRYYENLIIKELIYYGSDLYAKDIEYITPKMTISTEFIEKIKTQENFKKSFSEAIVLMKSSKYNLIGNLLINELKLTFVKNLR
jgi:ankyrin repeat protein